MRNLILTAAVLAMVGSIGGCANTTVQPVFLKEAENIDLNPDWKAIPGDPNKLLYSKNDAGECDIHYPHGDPKISSQAAAWLDKNCKPKKRPVKGS